MGRCLIQAKDQMIQSVKADAANRELAADKLFDEIAAAAEVLETTDEVFAAAEKRRTVGNPPGKPTSLGDQISWEALLSEVEDETDLHIISKDGDFASDLSADAVMPVLAAEWTEKNGGALALLEELRPFLNNNFPGVKLAIDIEKTEAIEQLVETGNFALTHSSISKRKDAF